MRASPLWAGVLSVLVCLFAARDAAGQQLIGAGSSGGTNGAEQCGWVLLRQPSPPADAERTDDAQVLLVPPFGTDGGPRTPGAFRLVRALENWPDAAAGEGGQLTVAISGKRGPIAGMQSPPGPTEVLSLWVEFDGSRWLSGPEGALDSSPALPADTHVLGMAGTRAGLMAAMTNDAWPRAGGPRVMLRSLREWRDATPRPEATDAPGALAFATTVLLVPSPEGAFLFASGPTLEDLRVWSATIAPGHREYSDTEDEDDTVAAPTASAQPATARWQSLPAPEVPGDARALIATSVNDQVILGWVRDGVVTLNSWRDAGWREVASVHGVTGEVVAVPLASEGRVVIVWREAVETTPTDARNLRLKFAEVSVATGRVMAQGDAELAGPATRSDYRAIGILMAWVSGIVAIIVLRPKEERVPLMPEGLAFAEPAQRMIAGTIDVVLCLVAAGFMLGRGPLEVLTTSATGLLTSTEGQLLLGLTLVLGVFSGTVGEWATGRTIGKVICGCGVADLTRPPPSGGLFQRVPFQRSLVRNIVKWCVPPAGLLGVLSASARHRGDEFAGAGVLSAIVEEEGGPGE